MTVSHGLALDAFEHNSRVMPGVLYDANLASQVMPTVRQSATRLILAVLGYHFPTAGKPLLFRVDFHQDNVLSHPVYTFSCRTIHYALSA